MTPAPRPVAPALAPALAAALLALLLVTAGWATAGCAADPSRGYSFASTYPAGIRTVAVPIFQNTTFNRGVEIELTDAVVKQIQSTTPWRVVSADRADAVLTGAVVDAQLRTLTTDRVTGLSQEVAVILSVNFDLRDTRSGREVASRRGFSAAETFVPAGGIGERLEVGEHATVQELAQAIVAELRSNW